VAKRQYKAPDLQRLDTPVPWPKISIVTAVRNGEKYIEETIRSVLQQNYPNLEYIVMDGGSTDGTLEIIQKYRQHIAYWVSEPDQGLFHALNKGFARSTGEIMGWLNASDMLQLNGLKVVGSVFGAFPQIDWITGRPTKFSPSGMTVNVWPTPHWSRPRFLAGANKYIQQESTYWRRSLWEKAGAALSTRYRAEGDFELWARFFRFAKLYTVDALIGGYRSHDDALSLQDLRQHYLNCDEITARELEDAPWSKTIKLFRWIDRHVKPIPKIRGLWHRLAIRGLYSLPGPDWTPVIVEDTKGWVARRR
jgi:glycosyltransferase involved in cell wall biosynthesis